MKNQKPLNRRDFIKKSTTVAAAFTIVPRYVLGGTGYTAPSDKLNIACVGVGGKGYSDTHGVASENIVALYDALLYNLNQIERIVVRFLLLLF